MLFQQASIQLYSHNPHLVPIFDHEIYINVTRRLFSTHFDFCIFQVVSIITTTGFVTADYTAWSPLLLLLFFGLMFLGGSAGSTSGGFKIMRHILII